MSENSACGCGRSAEAMEDVPMCRYSNPIPACQRGHGCGEPLERILEALNCQNQLLVDLLGAVNGLTAASLAQGERP